MKHMQVYVAAIVFALVPAAYGLWGNASFSQAVPIRVPEHARLATDDHPSQAVHVAREAGRERAGDTATQAARGGTDDGVTHDLADDHGGSGSGSRSGSGSGSDDTTADGKGSGGNDGAGDTSGGDTSGGDTSGGDTSGGGDGGGDKGSGSGGSGSHDSGGDKGSGGHGSDD